MSTMPPNFQPPPPMRPEDQRLWATLVHVGGIVSQFIVPLVGYLVLRDRGQFVRDHTRTALNFHLTMLIAYFVGCLLIIVVVGFFVIWAVAVLQLVLGIVAAVAANQGRPYRYPFTIEFVKD